MSFRAWEPEETSRLQRLELILGPEEVIKEHDVDSSFPSPSYAECFVDESSELVGVDGEPRSRIVALASATRQRSREFLNG